MAYMNQEKKQALSPAIKKVLAKYGLKGTISVRHHSTLIVNIKQGKLDFIQNFIDNRKSIDNDVKWSYEKGYIQVNQYWLKETYSGKVLDCLTELFAAMNDGNFDESDIQTDFFHVGWYLSINVGQYDKPYQVIK